MLRGQSKPAFMPRPFIQVHHAFPLQFLTAMYGPFGHVNPNAPVLPQVNNPRPHLPCPQLFASPPSLPLNPEASSSSEESDDSEGGDSLEVNPPSPNRQ